MSIHPSLRSSDKDKKARSVLKRTERLRTMLEKGQWKEGDDVYGLPKIKAVRIRIKKEKAEKTPGEAVSGATGGAAAPAATETKAQGPAAKGAAAKAPEKGKDKK